MTISVRIPTPLRTFTNGQDRVQVTGVTVNEALQSLGSAHEGIIERILSEQGDVRHFVNIFVGQSNIRSLEGLGTPLNEGDVLSIIPAVAGGAS